MTPVQQRLLQMLEEIDEICRENGITYYAAGGTTLGAVRHGGFIPWDDDIDIMMPRNDWRRFIEVAREGLPPNRVLSCIELSESYPHVFGRYTDTSTCSVHYNQFLGGTPEGLVIDIFILDAIPNAGESFRAHREALALYTDVANPLGYSYPMSSSPALLKRYAKRIQAEGRAPVLRELASRLELCDDADGEYLVMRWAAAPRLFHRSIFGFPRRERFEHLNISVPARLNDYLVQHYGDDWTQVPPVSGQITHDAITFTDIDYQKLLDDYLPFIDVERARKAILRRRQYHIDHMRELHHAEDVRARILARFAQATCELSPRQNAKEAGGGQDACAGDEERFSSFFDIQSLPEVAGREEYLTIRRYYDPVAVCLNEREFCEAVRLLANTNRLGRAARFLLIREQVNGGLTPPEHDVKNMVEVVRLPRSLQDVGCADEALALSRELLERYPENFSNRLFLLEELARRREWTELDEVASRGLELFPESGEFMRFRADGLCARLQAQRGEELCAQDEELREAARSLYAQAATHTTNAFHRGAALEQLQAIDSAGASSAGTHDAAFESVSSERPSAELAAFAEDAEPIQGIPGKRGDARVELLRCGDKALELLRELVDLCAEMDTPCFLGPMSCRIALSCEDGTVPSPELDLLVPAGQLEQVARRLIEDDRPGRAVDCWLTNGRYPAFAVDYVHTGTTFLQLDEGTDVGAPGVRVRIIPLRQRTAGKDEKALDQLELGWELNGYQLAKNMSKPKAIAAAKARGLMLEGRARAARKLFGRLCCASKPSCSSLAVRIPKRGLIELPDGLFVASPDMQADELVLGTTPFPAPADPQMLVAAVYGEGWESTTPAFIGRYNGDLICADLPYGDFLSVLSEEGYPASELFSLMRRIRWGMIPLAADLRVRNRAMRIAERSRDRKLWCDKLDAQWDAISALLDGDETGGGEALHIADHNAEELSRIYAGYEQDAKRYLKAGLGLCPSRRHMEVLCAIWRARGEAALADKLERLAPEQHFAPLK